jgi:carboxypeptidase family protein
MRPLRSLTWCAVVFTIVIVTARPAAAQLTTGSLAGVVKDAQGGVIPGATVTLVSQTRGTRSVPVVTSGTGDFVFPNLPADTYTIEVEMSGFKRVPG